MTIKLTHITPRFLPAIGGCEYYVYNLSRKLLKRGYEISIITSKSLNFNHPVRIDFKPPFISRDKKPLPLQYEVYNGLIIHRLTTIVNMPGTIIVYGLRDKLSSMDSDIFNLHEYLSNIVVSSIRVIRRKDNPIVLTAHDITFAESISPVYSVLWRLYNRLFSKILCSVDIIIVQNYRDKKILETICGDRVEIRVVYNGVDTDYFDPKLVDEYSIERFKKKYRLNRYDKILLFVGRLEERKRIDLLLKILYLLKRRMKERIGLLIVGPDYGDKKRLSAIAYRLGISKNIVFTGGISRDELRLAYMVADIYVTLSEQEAFGLTAAEALSMGKPVVTHQWRGLDEVVQHGVTGFKAKPFNYREAAIYVEKLLSDTQLYNTLSRNAYQVARSKYSIDRMVEEIDRIYRNLL